MVLDAVCIAAFLLASAAIPTRRHKQRDVSRDAKAGALALRVRTDAEVWLERQLGLSSTRCKQPPGGFDVVKECIGAVQIVPLRRGRLPRRTVSPLP